MLFFLDEKPIIDGKVSAYDEYSMREYRLCGYGLTKPVDYAETDYLHLL